METETLKIKANPDQSLLKGFIFGLMAALASAVLWAVVTVSTGFQVDYLAIGAGAAVGLTIRHAGKGQHRIFRVMGGFFAFTACVLGNIFSAVGFLASKYALDFSTILAELDNDALAGILIGAVTTAELLFYGVAVFAGVWLSVAPLSDRTTRENDDLI